jgi:hypothetical protein
MYFSPSASRISPASCEPASRSVILTPFRFAFSIVCHSSPPTFPRRISIGRSILGGNGVAPCSGSVSGKLSTKPYIPMLEENNAHQGFVDHGDFLKLKANYRTISKTPYRFCITPDGEI